jgi:transcriptional regulator with PAS, ATPase and Fis domain
VRTSVLDDQPEIAGQFHRLLSSTGAPVLFSGARLLIAPSGTRDVLSVDLAGSAPPAELAAGPPMGGPGELALSPNERTGGLAPVAESRALPLHGIIGRSRVMADVLARCAKVAEGDANAAIVGESGTGKELIARYIHYASSRRHGPLITLDCTTIPEGLTESHLFGHVKGAFTGAIGESEGVFSLAHTGTLFIDELAELSPPLQAKLLRVVQTREFFKVGGTKPIRTDIRLITATNKDLKQEVQRGRFREDLYYRVAVVMIKLPPLRERREDIPLLVEHFIGRFARRHGKRVLGIEPATMDRLVKLRWRGNVREIQNLVEQAVVLAEGEVLTEADFFTEDAPANEAASEMSFEPCLRLSEVERLHILRTLRQTQGNRTRAAALLGISVRCLQYKLKSYGRDLNSSGGRGYTEPVVKR